MTAKKFVFLQDLRALCLMQQISGLERLLHLVIASARKGASDLDGSDVGRG